jgi:hypothetical protein
MWLTISLGLKLNPPVAVLLDRVFRDIAFYLIHAATGNRSDASFVDGLRDVSAAFERFRRLSEAAMPSGHFRPAPLCFAPVSYWPSAFYEAAERGAVFAYGTGKLLEERLGLPGELPSAGIVPAECGGYEFLKRVDLLTAHTGELLCSGDLAMVVLAHRMLLQAQRLCAVLARFRQLRPGDCSGLAAAAPVFDGTR